MVLIQVPEVLREKLGPDGAQALVDLLNEAGGRLRDDVLTLAEERFRRHLSEEIGLFRQEMAREMALFRQEIAREIGALRQEFGGLRQEFGGLRQEFGGEVRSLRQELADLRVEVASVKSDLTWRLFYFWTAHLIAIAGLLLAFFKLFA
ncbi:MAG: hypothetical protein HY702_07755 [Gemmatimonadetes bacterium]|nr:hypothetical protein [Gemmatimonadota bacterium]